MTLRLPDQTWSSAAPVVQSPVVAAAVLNETATPASKSQLTVAADRAPLRVLYGRVRIGAQIANVVPYGSNWVVQAIWGDGPIDAIESVWQNDEAYTGTVTHYLGSGTPAADATLVAAFAANGVTYVDTLPGIAYSVFVLPSSEISGMPQLAAVIRGRLLYDRRSGLTVWSNNPALALADFLSSSSYGLGMSIDTASVDVAADACDALVGADKRRTIGLAIDSVQDARAWVETLRSYAGCWVFADAGVARLVADRPRATDLSITHAAGQISKLGRIKKRGTARLPNRVEIRYTDTSATPWRDASVWSPSMGLSTGIPDSQVALPGIQSASQAYREAVERLNKLWLSDLSVELEMFDDGLAVEVGDVIEVTHPIGLAAKKLRVLSTSSDYGRFSINALEYDPAVYSDGVTSNPTYLDTNLPNPAAPPALAGLAIAEEVYQMGNGNYASRIRATWAAPGWPYLHRYYVELWDGSSLIASGNTEQIDWASPAIQEGTLYLLRACIISSVGAAGTWANQSLTAAGKLLLPGNVPAISAFEVGGEVRVTIDAAVDLDLKFYELRYDAGTATYPTTPWADIWAAATFVDATPAASGVGGFIAARTIPVGTWRLLCCALDSVNQYSPIPAAQSVTVTLDSNAYLVGDHSYSSPTPTGMAEYSLPADAHRYWVTEDGVAAATKFPGTASTYTDIAATYHASMASELISEANDFGTMLAGSWQGAVASEALSGTKSDVISLSPDGSTYTDQASLSVKANARFAKVKTSASGTSTLKVTLPQMSLRVDATPREEGGEVTTNATGATVITLSNPCAKFKSINVVPIGTTPCSWRVNDLITGATPSFEIYTFNPTTGAQISTDVLWNTETV